jgi:large subunit ribosomal protein L10
MPRPEKVQAVAEIKERMEGAQAVFLAEYAGLSVTEQQDLRRSLREHGAEFKVVKMTLARRAADDLDIDTLDELLLGPTGLAFADGDPVSAAKALKDFAKEHAVFQVKGGLLGQEFLTPEKISELADIEPREVLLAKLAGAMKAPMANMAGLLAALPRNTASALQQLLEKKEAGEFVGESDETDEPPAAADEAAEAADEAAEAGDEDAAEEVEESTDDAEVDDAEGETAEGSDPVDEATDTDDGDEDDDEGDEETEDDSEATAEASADADADDTEETTDEASDDGDAEEK